MVYPPTNVRKMKKFSPHKILANFHITTPNYNRAGWGAETMLCIQNQIYNHQILSAHGCSGSINSE